MGSVVAGLVVSGFLWMFGLIPVGQWMAIVWAGLSYPIPVPLVILLALIGALLVLAVGALLRSATPLPPWLNYREDNFLGIVWRWSYDGTHIARWTIRPYCPRCNTGLRGEQHGYKDITTSFICDECRFTHEIPGNGDDILDRICRLIEREANTKLVRP